MPEPRVTEHELAVVVTMATEQRQIASEYDTEAGRARSEATALELVRRGRRARERANTLLGLIDKLERWMEG